MPNSFTRINPGSDIKAAMNQVNQNFAKLDREAVTKKFGQGDNQVVIGKAGDYIGMVVGDITTNAIIFGRYRDDRLGTLYIQNGIPTELQGQSPDDGRMGHWIAKPGENVITLLGG